LREQLAQPPLAESLQSLTVLVLLAADQIPKASSYEHEEDSAAVNAHRLAPHPKHVHPCKDDSDYHADNQRDDSARKHPTSLRLSLRNGTCSAIAG